MRLRNLVRSAPILAVALGLAGQALAADPVFPPSSRFGFDPPPDMVSSKRFSGLERIEGAPRSRWWNCPPTPSRTWRPTSRTRT